MKLIMDQLDSDMLGLLPNEGIRFFGLAQLVTKDDQPNPVTIEDNKQIAINDRYEAIVYHRILNGSLAPAEDRQFGTKLGRKMIQNMRTIVAYKAGKGEEWIQTFCNNFPEEVNVSGYDFIDIPDLSLIADQVAVYNAEFGINNYEKHIQDWNIYALEYSVEFIKC